MPKNTLEEHLQERDKEGGKCGGRGLRQVGGKEGAYLASFTKMERG